MTISVNKKGLEIFREFMKNSVPFAVNVEKHPLGAVIIDAGIKALGGYAAGKIITEICLGGFGAASIMSHTYGDLSLPTVHVETDYPAISTLGSQFAGWRVKVDKYFAMASGPARALALKPKELYEKIGYKDKSENAVIVLEADAPPTPEALKYMAEECEVKVRNLSVVVAPTQCQSGSVQIAGRIVETGIHKLTEIGFDPKRILYGSGYAPIAPIHPKSTRAMGRTNDSLLYGGVTFYNVDYEDDEKLKEMVVKVPSSTSRNYGKPFYDTFKEAEFDFFKIDPGLFAPAVITVNNVRTGSTFTAGYINPDLLKKSFGL